MATTLPPLSGNGSRLSQSHSIQQYRMPKPPKATSNGKPILQPLHRPKGRKERELMEKTKRLRAQQPSLSKYETTAYRNTFKHTLCLDMLQDGYHRSFNELFALMSRQRDDRALAGPESVIWAQTLIEDEQDKLEVLKCQLTRAETAMRKGDNSEVYRARYDLARFFQKSGDKWLADHFFNTCLATSNEVKNDGGMMQAEGFCNVGLSQEENGDYYGATENIEAFFKLTSQNLDWKREEGQSLHNEACIHLYRLYTTIGIVHESSDAQQSLTYFLKAYNMAQQSSEASLEAEAGYRLGLAYEKTGDAETALLHLNKFLESSKSAENNEGIGKACDAIAKAYARKGKVERSIEYLQEFVTVSEKSGQEKEFSKACHNLGAVFNSLGRYEEATEYFSKAYNLSRALNDGSTINTSRVQFGISMAHKVLQRVSCHVDIGSRPCMERLVEWKSSRIDDFDKEIPDPVVEEETAESNQQRDTTAAEPETTEDTPADEGDVQDED